MNNIFAYNYVGFEGETWKITICSGPVIINSEWKLLLHISSSTKKYQFIWGRLNDSESLQENALSRAKEVLGHSEISLILEAPLCIHWEILRDWKTEKLVLFHYKAKLTDESSIWDAVWKTLSEIKELEKQDMLSSKNVVIASKYFLEK
jgi:hypothetical protein